MISVGECQPLGIGIALHEHSQPAGYGFHGFVGFAPITLTREQAVIEVSFGRDKLPNSVKHSVHSCVLLHHHAFQLVVKVTRCAHLSNF